jgi:hypothetical protein
MQSYQEFNKIYKEITNFHQVIEECLQITKTQSNYIGMSLEELSMLYDKIEGGLISYNFVLQKNSAFFTEITESSQNSALGGFLESQLLNVALNMLTKDPSHKIPQKFKDSLWNEKMKDKEYYNKICNLAPILPEHRETLYSFLQK